MIVRRGLQLRKVLPYVWKELLLTAALSAASLLAPWMTLPFGPLGVLGTALAIFLGFRGNTGYARWWEARTLWGNVANNSRALARIVITAVDNACRAGKAEPDRAKSIAREVVYRQIAFAHALRLHLRGPAGLSLPLPLLAPSEHDRLATSQNRPNMILQTQAARLKDAAREDLLGTFDPIALERNLAALQDWLGACERIKNTPVPAQYAYFTRVFVWLFLALLPPSLASLFPEGSRWIAPPLALLLAFVYGVAGKVGEVCDDPFESGPHDVPLSALCAVIERDLREQLGEENLPAPPAPVDGYLD